MDKDKKLQNEFLSALNKEATSVAIYLVNGIKLQGQVGEFDQHVIMLKGTVTQMVYKHAVSTIVPAQEVSYQAADFVEQSSPQISDVGE